MLMDIVTMPTNDQPNLNQLSVAHIAGISPPPKGAKIAFQGAAGAYSDLACKTLFPDAISSPCQSFADAFSMASKGLAHYAVIPIENSLGGRVSDVHDLLPNSGLYIVGEYFQPINHCLWGVKGAKLEDIQEVRSHEQALSQCKINLNALKVKAVASYDTAGAARDLAASGQKNIAVLSSVLAGEIYGLSLLRARMEDRLDNVTRFIILSTKQQQPDYQSQADYITSLYFETKSVPASLYKSLGGFATNQINLIRLESYISLADQSRASFYVELEGHPSQKALSQAFEELQYFTGKLKTLGVYLKSPYRNTLPSSNS